MNKLWIVIVATIALCVQSHSAELETLNKLIDDLRELAGLPAKVKELEASIEANASDQYNAYQFQLKDENGDGYVDEEWEEIIEKGQLLQVKVWIEKEKYWTERLGPAPANQTGWYGTSTMPTIQIICSEGEYFFRNTARLPGRFQLTCFARWGSMLRFYGTGDKVVKDDIAYGVATNANVGIYVEPKTIVETAEGTMIVKPFEQRIEKVIIVAMDNVLPVYLADNSDRFSINDCNIQQHKGAQIGIKHGPALQRTSYPFAATQITDGNVYLADPRFENLQMEGPHNARRRQAAIFASGNNMLFIGINFYGWNHGIYCHGGQNRVVANCTAHWGITADGRQWTTKDDIVLYLLSTRTGNTPDAAAGNAGGFKGWIIPKGSMVPSAGGWHNAGEYCL